MKTNVLIDRELTTKCWVGFIVWLDRSVDSRWFCESRPKKSNYEKGDREEKSIRSVLCDPEWPKVAVLNNPVNAAGDERQSRHGANHPPCAAASDPNVKL